AGKSTFLNLLSGEIIADSGKIELEDADISNIKAHKRAKFISKVHQDPSKGTAPSMTVLENMSMASNKGKKFGLGFGLEISKIEEFKSKLETLGLGIENQLETRVESLSGGQRQCLSLLMSTFNEPKILLLDEHTAALDPKTSNIILEKTKEIVEQNKNTITFMITHNM
ncbi:ABC transporter ATP-binding protein, partial [Oceanivirga salmonicida]